MPPNAPQFTRLDADENIFFARQLEQVRAKTYDLKYPGLIVRDLVPVDHEVDPGAETVKYEQFDMVGAAKIISSYSKDLPRIDIKGKEFFQVLKSIGESYGFNIQEIRAAKFAGKPLTARRASTARRVMEQKIDDIGATGDSGNGLQGFLGITNAQTFTVVNGVSGTATWATKTPDEVLKDMNGIVNQIVEQTKGVEIPDTLVLPLAQFNDISTRRVGTASDTTILKFFLGTSPYIKTVVPWIKTKAAGAAGKDRMVAYRRDPDALQLVMAQEYEEFAPEPDGLEFKIACHARTGGVVAYYPMSICYGDGI